MTTPHPLRSELDELLNGLAAPQGRAVRVAIVRAVHDLFDAATARPEPPAAISDTNGSAPEEVHRALFPSDADVDRLMAHPLNGIDPPPPRN